jgi:hypothetical protein
VRQKDRDARWTKKHGRSFFGYKNHVNADTKHKLIRHYAVTHAAVHDSQELVGLLDMGNTCNDVFADSAYRSAEIESKLRASGYNSRIHRRGRCNHPLSLTQVRANHAKSRIRARIEHVFGAQQNAPGGRIVRTIGIMRTRAKIGFAEPGLQHSPPGDAGTARRGMKTVESSAVYPDFPLLQFEQRLRGWACRIRTGKSVRELPDWNCLSTSPNVGASWAAETLRVQPASDLAAAIRKRLRAGPGR